MTCLCILSMWPYDIRMQKHFKSEVYRLLSPTAKKISKAIMNPIKNKRKTEIDKIAIEFISRGQA
jgi:hypothetical protein